jgi:hypothetical protein
MNGEGSLGDLRGHQLCDGTPFVSARPAENKNAPGGQAGSVCGDRRSGRGEGRGSPGDAAGERVGRGRLGRGRRFGEARGVPSRRVKLRFCRKSHVLRQFRQPPRSGRRPGSPRTAPEIPAPRREIRRSASRSRERSMSNLSATYPDGAVRGIEEARHLHLGDPGGSRRNQTRWRDKP